MSEAQWPRPNQIETSSVTNERNASPRSLGRAVAVACLALAGGLATPAVADDFAGDLRAALSLHEESSNFEEQDRALQAFRGVAEAHPDRWLGHFWTAYAETQIARLVARQQGEGDGPPAGYLDRAQSHLDRATALAAAASEHDRSSLAALQSLIYQFRARGATDDQIAQWHVRADRALAEASRLDPANPVVLIFTGTALVSLGQQESHLEAALAAVSLLRQASSKLASVSDRSTTTYFNAEWLPFWLPRAEQMLESQVGALSDAP